MNGLIEAIQSKIDLNEFYVPFDNTLTDDTNWNSPDIRPTIHDKSIDGWFKRLSTWGEIKFTYIDRDGKRTELNQNDFVNKLLVGNIQDLYSHFRIELRHIYEVDFIRTISSPNETLCEEVFKVYVKLKPDLKKGLSLWTKLFN